MAAQNGNLSAFEEILFSYEKPILNYIYRIVGRREDAEDLTQETFLKLYKSLGTIDPENNFNAWIYKIATNTAYDWLRQKGRKKELFVIDDTYSGFETIDSSATYNNIADTSDVELALKKIKPIYRTVLFLFYYEDLDYRQISDILSIPINTVKTHLHRAKQLLKKELSNL